MTIMSLPILERGNGGWSHLRGDVLLKQNYHLYTMKCATQSEATTQGRVHHAELVTTMRKSRIYTTLEHIIKKNTGV